MAKEWDSWDGWGARGESAGNVRWPDWSLFYPVSLSFRSQPEGFGGAASTALANSVQITIGGIAASVQFAGLTESGLYQFNVVVPNLPNGDAAVVAQIGGVKSAGVAITVQQ